MFGVNVMDFGAVGDGITDDFQAIQDAIDDVDSEGGGTVLFPPGDYSIEETLTMDQGIYLEGISPKSARISSNVDVDEWAIEVTRSHRSFFDAPDMGGIEKLQVKVNTEGANGIEIIDGWYFSLREMILMGGSWEGFNAPIGISMRYGDKGTAYCRLDNVLISYCDTGLVIDGGAAERFANRYNFSGLHIIGVPEESTYGLKIIRGDTHTGFVETEHVETSIFMDAAKRCILNVILEGNETTSLEMVNMCVSNKLVGNFDANKLELTSHWKTMLFTDSSFRLPYEVGLFDASPVQQQARITDPSGGAVIDVESRETIVALIEALESIGVLNI